jgi:hypothetical protein
LAGWRLVRLPVGSNGTITAAVVLVDRRGKGRAAMVRFRDRMHRWYYAERN